MLTMTFVVNKWMRFFPVNLQTLKPLRNLRLCIRMCFSSQLSAASNYKNDDDNRPRIPTEPTWIDLEVGNSEEPIQLSEDYVNHLERLSLVRFSNKDAVHHLEKAIRYADQLQNVNTEGVEPMYTVLEDRMCRLREDRVEEGGQREEVLQNAKKKVEDYFVTPPGNIPLEQREKKLGIIAHMKQRNKI